MGLAMGIESGVSRIGERREEPDSRETMQERGFGGVREEIYRGHAVGLGGGGRGRGTARQ